MSAPLTVTIEVCLDRNYWPGAGGDKRAAHSLIGELAGRKDVRWTAVVDPERRPEQASLFERTGRE